MRDEMTDDYDVLVTRALSYVKPDNSSLAESTETSISSGSVKQRTSRGKTFFICKKHHEEIGKWAWKPSSGECTDCIMYKSKLEFRNGFLPLGMEVMEYLLTQRFTNWGRQMDNIKISSKDLILQ